MGWRGKAADKLNQVLNKANLNLTRRVFDFEDRLLSGRHLDLMFGRLASEIDEWLARQTIFTVLQPFDVKQEIAAFYADYLRASFRDESGGSRFNNLLWLDIIAKALQPTVVVDSGTYTGASAWALSRGAPGAAIVSFDIDLSSLRTRMP